MSCYASANCRSECATYKAVCGKRATLLSNAQDGRNRLSGRNVKRSAIRAWGQYHSRVIGSTGGECGQLRSEKALQRKRPCRSRATARRSLLRHACVKRCKGQPESVRCGRK